MDPDRHDLEELFSGIAPYYDQLNRILSFNAAGKWRRIAARMAGAGSGETVLDLCTGTGELALEFSRLREPPEVFGVDFSGRMLQKASEKIRRRGREKNIRLVEADVLKLPFRSGSFDVVSLGFGLRNLLDRRNGLAAAAGMLKPGGRMVILEFTPPAKNFFGGLYRFYLARLLPFIAGSLGGSLTGYRYLSASIIGFLDPGQVISFMEDAGLRNIVLREMNLGTVNVYYGQKGK